MQEKLLKRVDNIVNGIRKYVIQLIYTSRILFLSKNVQLILTTEKNVLQRCFKCVP